MTHLPNKSKYRPVLTEKQLSHIIDTLKLESPLSSTGIGTIHYLTGFLFKIQHAGSIPAYTAKTPKAPKGKGNSLAELGADIPPKTLISKEEQWAKSYAIYSLTPEACSKLQVDQAYEHMYLNDLMTTEQIEAFESCIFNTNPDTEGES